jgi:hypothetical protein
LLLFVAPVANGKAVQLRQSTPPKVVVISKDGLQVQEPTLFIGSQDQLSGVMHVQVV